MKHQWVIFCAFLCVCASNKPKLRGLSPEDYSLLHYNEEEFTCRDGSKTIPFSQVNDNYCDCSDSSDEPGTSACSNGKFWCRNTGHVGKYIFSSQVGDGICDCCDGSDERDHSGSNCQNTCAALARELRKEIEKEIAAHQAGLEEKARLIAAAAATLKELESEVKTLEELTPSLQQQLSDAETRKREAEEAEEQQKRLQDNSADQTQEGKGEEAADPADAGDSGDSPDSRDSRDSGDSGDSGDLGDLGDEALEDSYSDDDDDAMAPLRAASKAAERKLKEAQDFLKTHEKDLEKKKKILETDFGPQKEFFYLRDQCYSLDTPQYTYELCPFDKVTQKPKSGSSTSLGTWEVPQPSGWEETHRRMKYSGGAKCWGGPSRSTLVSVECSALTYVSHVDEPNKCEYTLTLHSPAACREEHLLALQLDVDVDTEEEE